jgi:hypothetical protein
VAHIHSVYRQKSDPHPPAEHVMDVKVVGSRLLTIRNSQNASKPQQAMFGN